MKLKIDENVDVLPSGIFKVADETALESFTRSGWKLVYILQEEQTVTVLEPMSASETEQQALRGYQHHYYNTHDGVTVPPGMRAVSKLAVRNRYVLVQDEQSVVANAERRIADAEQLATQAQQEAATHRRTLEEAKAENTKQAHELGRLRSEVERYDKTLGESQRVRRTLEQDIGAIRVAIGAEKMKEILGR